MDIEVTTITAERKELYPQLNWSYENIYLPRFPISKDQESLEKIKAVIEGGFKGVSAVVQIVGYDLNHKTQYDIRGICIAYYYEQQNAALLANIATHPEKPLPGIGKLMIHGRIESLKAAAKARGRSLDAVGIECNNPERVRPEQDSMPPATRLEMFNHLGARRVPIRYIDPPWPPHGYYNENMCLLTYPIQDPKDALYKHPGPEGVERIIRGIWREGRGDRNVDADPKFQQMKSDLESWKRAARAHAANSDTPPNYMRNLPKFRLV